jgi:hypothetical protein
LAYTLHTKEALGTLVNFVGFLAQSSATGATFTAKHQ